MRWVKGLFLQPREDDRVSMIAREVESVRHDVADVKRRVEALEAFRKVAGEY